MKTILITNDPAIAIDAQSAGVTHIMVDLEINGKKERQASRTTFISTHVREDVAKIRAVLTTAELIVRINAWGENSKEELDYAIGQGADLIMLPMITSVTQMDGFLAHLAGRARPLPLLETSYSMAHVEDLTAHPEVKEVFIGLNDLHLSLGLDFLFEPLALGLIDWMAGKIKAQGKPFGFGGIAMLGSDAQLPPERILAEHVRIGSTQVILSSQFAKDVNLTQSEGRANRLKTALHTMQQTAHGLSARTPVQQNEDFAQTKAIILSLAEKARNRPKQG